MKSIVFGIALIGIPAIAIAQTGTKTPAPAPGQSEFRGDGDRNEMNQRQCKPNASGANPAGALPCVAPMMMNRNMAVITNSVSAAAPRPYLPGECSAYPFDANPLARSKPGAPLAMRYRTAAATMPPTTWATM